MRLELGEYQGAAFGWKEFYSIDSEWGHGKLDQPVGVVNPGNQVDDLVSQCPPNRLQAHSAKADAGTNGIDAGIDADKGNLCSGAR